MKTGCALCLIVLAGALATPASASDRDCRPVLDPYPGTRFAGEDLTRIRAEGVSCRTARRVARRAHAKALRLPVPVSGIRRYTWRSWNIRGDLRPARDEYVARRGEQRVRWRF